MLDWHLGNSLGGRWRKVQLRLLPVRQRGKGVTNVIVCVQVLGTVGKLHGRIGVHENYCSEVHAAAAALHAKPERRTPRHVMQPCQIRRFIKPSPQLTMTCLLKTYVNPISSQCPPTRSHSRDVGKPFKSRLYAPYHDGDTYPRRLG